MGSSENKHRSLSGAATERVDRDAKFTEPSDVVVNETLPFWLIQRGLVVLLIRFP